MSPTTTSIIIRAIELAQPVFNARYPKVFRAGSHLHSDDWDIGIVNVPFVGQHHIAIGKLDLWINDEDAEASFVANRAMAMFHSEEPEVFNAWNAMKATAKAACQSEQAYSRAKAEWHSRMGLPSSHYAKKAGQVSANDLPFSIDEFLF